MGDDWDDDSPATNQPSAPGLTAVVRKYFAILHVLHIFCISGKMNRTENLSVLLIYGLFDFCSNRS